MTSYFSRFRCFESILYTSTVLAASGIFVGCSPKTELPKAPPVAVECMTLATTNYQAYVEIVGKTESPSTIQFQAQVSGTLLKTPLKEGYNVKAGDLLFEIDSASYQATRDAAAAQVAIEEAQEVKAKADLERSTKLLHDEAISAAQYDIYVAAEKEATASVALAKAKLQAAEIDLGHTKITAPFDGLIGETLIKAGNLVTANTSTLGSMSQVDPMYVTFSISEQKYLELTKSTGRENLEITEETMAESEDVDVELVQLDGTIYPLKGKFFFIDRKFSEDTGTLKFKVKFDNKAQLLRPNQFGRVRIPGEQFENVFVLPLSAIVNVQDKKIVYIIDNENKANMRPLNIAYKTGNIAIVKEGLAVGERIVTAGILKLKNGTNVRPVEQGANSATSAPVENVSVE